ncbi:NADH-quinone oxidoreductase subunit L [Actinomadura rubteroloni]|uniref:NADH-quinone oxidoreductase subunit L n=1 Tax=Actinomadura rubteroloni TaxID=1926885 RepID=A0A2P4UKA9_9ACTN|nr:proton-conducting transporter membrane subunit [Actinomadura rubteroloni]POM25456.1 NADH-quinone oxidoreductase subunit L [Actinomadura rubteroloni]
MIVLAVLIVLLPFAAAVAGLLAGPRVTRLLGGAPATAAPEGHTVVTEAEAGADPDAVQEGATPPAAARFGLRNGPALLACVPAGAAFVLAAIVGLTLWRSPHPRSGALTVVETGAVPIRVAFQVDGLAALLGVLVCAVAVAVQLYSVAYMAKDPRYSSYAAFVSLFTAAMLLVVFSRDLLLLYVGWEIMGVCSYFLIGHHWEDRANSRAAVKAFLVTRLGDVGFLIGILVLGVGASTFDIPTLLGRLDVLPHGTLVAAALLLLAGVAGKSAQFPLHTWLPDAMAGPTPISALIHAATMVAAGIYVVARLYPLYLAAPAALAVLGVLAVVSMVGAALAALAQDDLKRVLAYSTISQLAVMAAGLAVGAKSAAIFHLVAHGAFKAVLFLAAGCVIFVTGTNLLAGHGGLRTRMPLTFAAMTVGFAALAGVPPVSGWFSKDAVIEGAQHAATHGGELEHGLPAAGPHEAISGLREGVSPYVKPGQIVVATDFRIVPTIPTGIAWLIYLALLLTVALTAAYAMRAWLLTFFGDYRGTGEPREAPRAMSWTIAVLAVPAAILGFFGLGADELRPHPVSALLGVALLAAGAAATYLVWRRDPAADPARVLGRVRPVFARAFLVDELYAAAIVRPVRRLARGVAVVDRQDVDGAVTGTARLTRRLADVVRRPGGGDPQSYLTGVLAGVVVIVAVVVVFL